MFMNYRKPPLRGKGNVWRVLALAMMMLLLAVGGRGLTFGYDGSDQFRDDTVASWESNSLHIDGSKNLVFPRESVRNDVQSSSNVFVVGGFDASRGGSASFLSGSYFTQGRTSLSANFPNSSLTSFTTLTQRL